MNKEIKWIIIETLDITPSEFEKRFEVDTHFMPNEDIYIKQIAEKCYNLDRNIDPVWGGDVREVNY